MTRTSVSASQKSESTIEPVVLSVRMPSGLTSTVQPIEDAPSLPMTGSTTGQTAENVQLRWRPRSTVTPLSSVDARMWMTGLPPGRRVQASDLERTFEVQDKMHNVAMTDAVVAQRAKVSSEFMATVAVDVGEK